MRYAIQLEKRTRRRDPPRLPQHHELRRHGLRHRRRRQHFSTDAANLTIAQAATIAGMVQAPNTYRIDRPDGRPRMTGNPVNSAADGYKLTLDRRNYVLGRMLDLGKISQAEYDEAYNSPITPNITEQTRAARRDGRGVLLRVRALRPDRPAFGEDDDTRAANLRRGGMKIYTTLDPTCSRPGSTRSRSCRPAWTT
jgi:membrane peptidoglycan carboxypeptidase